MLLDLWLQFGHLQLQERVELIEVGFHWRIHLGKASSGHLVSFGLGTDRHVALMKAIRCALAKFNRRITSSMRQEPLGSPCGFLHAHCALHLGRSLPANEKTNIAFFLRHYRR